MEMNLKGKTIFISDVHLGTPRCNTSALLKLLDGAKGARRLVLVGDIVDVYCMEKYGTKWRREHTECVHKVLELAQSGTEIVYVLGNHEEALRRYVSRGAIGCGNLKVANEYVYTAGNGCKYLCTHGDKYSEYSSGSWKQIVFNWGYEFVTPLSMFLERFTGFSLVYALKNSVRGKGYIKRFERDLAKEAKGRGFDGVIVGHIHCACSRTFFGMNVHYVCCGDFVDSCTFVVDTESDDGINGFKVFHVAEV